MSIPKYISLLHQQLQGSLSEASARELDEWRKEDAEHEAIARQTEKAWELSRRYKADFQPDASAGFAQLKAKMAATETKVVPLQPRRRNWTAIAASLLLLAGCFAVWQMTRSDVPAEVAMISVKTQVGEQRQLQLPDGSNVVLNENSSISYIPDMHESVIRRLNLSGEAYFDIAKDQVRPFIITTDYATVRVLGTAFNVRAYRNEAQTEVEVERGKVALQSKAVNEALVLGIGQRGMCSADGTLDRQKSPELRAHSWRTGKLAFRATPMDQVVESLERYYKVRIEFADAAMANCPFSGSFEKENLDVVLQTIEVTLNAKAVLQGNDSYVLKGGGCK